MSTSAESKPARPKQVAIFGAGIAGLTAAHELIERGYKVEVYEMKKPSIFEQIDGVPCSIGGMAGTQWARVERPVPETPTMCSTQRLRLMPRDTIAFKKGTAKFANAADANETIERMAESLVTFADVKRIEVRGFCDDPAAKPYEDFVDRIDWTRAVLVVAKLRDALRKRLKGEVTQLLKPTALGLGYPDDWTRADADRNYVSFHIIEDWIPGEHGFRFFPSFYRNLFDTMRRTPIAEEQQEVFEETTRSVFDNVVPTVLQGVGTSTSKRAFAFRRRAVPSAQEFYDQLREILPSMGLTLTDVTRLSLKLFKYMTSCPARRAAEYERQSWWDFLEAEQFSEGAQKYVNAIAETALATDARHSDARTYGNTSVQMLMDQFSDTARTDGTLNGPASVVWFDHWRRYLEVQGVEFRRGIVNGFQFFEGRVWPVVILESEEEEEGVKTGSHEDQEDEVPTVLIRDYYVLALPAHVIQGLVRDYPQLEGEDFDRIRSFELGDRTKAETGGAVAHMGGIQYYFKTDIRILEGHSIYPDSPWRLSAISQPQFWMKKRGWWSGYRGILSVDISNWTNPGSNGRPAWECTRDEIAQEVWAQIRTTLESQVRGSQVAPGHIPEPTFYHLDDGVLFERDSPRGQLPAKNRMPYLTNRPGEYPKRPATPGKYPVHFDRLVLAGTFPQTHTRLTSMEAANESARHAVNAILDKDDFKGERCAVANPEECEPADLRFLVELDERLHGQGLPHFVDILDLREVPRALLRSDPDLHVLRLADRLAGKPEF